MYWLRNLSRCHYVQHVSQTDWPGINPRPLECSQCYKTYAIHTHKQLLMKGFFYSLSTNVLETTFSAFQKDVPQHYNGLRHCCVVNSKVNYGQVSFYARVTFLKRSHKLNTKCPLKTVHFLGLRGLKTSSYTKGDPKIPGIVKKFYSK